MRYRALVVDDDPIIRKLLNHVFTVSGYTVTCAMDGCDALSLLEDEEFDLLITDLQMGKINGYEVILKERERSDNTRIIMISGCGDGDCQAKALQLGADYFIAKPFSLTELFEVVPRPGFSHHERRNATDSTAAFHLHTHESPYSANYD